MQYSIFCSFLSRVLVLRQGQLKIAAVLILQISSAFIKLTMGSISDLKIHWHRIFVATVNILTLWGYLLCTFKIQFRKSVRLGNSSQPVDEVAFEGTVYNLSEDGLSLYLYLPDDRLIQSICIYTCMDTCNSSLNISGKITELKI
jgi:hypothetical protein